MSKTRHRQGFTIVELLIVIVVIAILAAISIVAYSGIQNRANDTAVQSDLRNIGQKFVEFQVVNGRLPGFTSSDLGPLGLKVSRNAYGSHYSPSGQYNMAYCIGTPADTFAIVAASKSGTVYVYGGGTVSKGAGPLVTVMTTCANNGIPSATAANWFYNSGSWNSSIGG